MRRLCFSLLLVLLLCMGCAEQQFAVSLLGGTATNRLDELDEGRSPTTEYIGRVGAILDPNTELGFSSHFWESEDNSNQTYGVYVQRFLVVEPNDLTLLGRPYLNAQASLGIDNDGSMWGFGAGTAHFLGGIEVLTEFQVREYNDALQVLNGDDTDYRGYVGARFRF